MYDVYTQILVTLLENIIVYHFIDHGEQFQPSKFGIRKPGGMGSNNVLWARGWGHIAGEMYVIGDGFIERSCHALPPSFQLKNGEVALWVNNLIIYKLNYITNKYKIGPISKTAQV